MFTKCNVFKQIICIYIYITINDINYSFRIVIDTLKNVDPKRKCYRMIGGVLCERTVEDVMPTLVTNKEQVWLTNKFSILF